MHGMKSWDLLDLGRRMYCSVIAGVETKSIIGLMMLSIPMVPTVEAKKNTMLWFVKKLGKKQAELLAK